MLRCPVCRGTNLYVLAGGCIGYIYGCKDCGYRGALVLECGSRKEGDEHGSASGE